MKQFLILGFDCFGGAAVNASQRLIEQLQTEQFVRETAELAVLPTSYKRSVEAIETLIARTSPQYVFCFGEAGARTCINIERIAINAVDAPIADNDGQVLENRSIIEGGPDGLFCTLPLKQLLEACAAAKVPAQISNTAGVFVCNYVLYQLLHLTRDTEAKAGFFHLPYVPEAAVGKLNLPTMATETAVRGVTAMMQALLNAN